jgi:hypothetical protein
MSIDNVIIDYNSETNKVYRRIKGTSLKLLIVNMIRLIQTLINLRTIKRRLRKFEEFTAKKLILTQKYHNYDDLRGNPPKADCYIAGSDQLWNVSVLIRKEFFLDFAAPTIKRASFAVSMGSCEVPIPYKKPLCELLRRFDAISVREQEAKTMIENILNKKDFVTMNCDPVFMLTKKGWSDLACERNIGFKYILCYPMAGHPLLNEALKKLKQFTGYQIVIIVTETFTLTKGDVYIMDASPEEFVYLIQKAEFVLTTSFHGTAFSTIFNKNFFSFLGGTASGRITELLARLGLEDRIVRSLDDIHTETIDFTKANHIINEEKELAEEYLLSL